jgi:hypothetical protein
MLSFACTVVQARVTRIVIDATAPLPAPAGVADGPIAYEQIAGRAFGELDPALPVNALIQDIALAKDADGKVRYVASFVLYKPVDTKRASGLMWHDVPNRGRVFPMDMAERLAGDVLLASAWQGDNAGNTAVKPAGTLTAGQWLQLPVARGANGERITGEVFGRIVNRAGPDSQPLWVQTNPVPYKPLSLDTTKARLVSRGGETQRGEVIDEVEIASSEWAWAACSADKPFPGTPDPTQICLKRGFDPKRLYQVVFTAADPYVLGIGFAAWRDVGQFFKSAKADDQGTPNPVAGALTHSIGRGVSQSGNFLRGWLHLGFNQDEAGRQVHDGRLADHRRPPHRAELPLGAARRRARALPGRQRRAAVVAAASGPGARPARGGHPRSLQRQPHLPQGHRALRLGRGVGAEADARVDRHRCEGRPAAARERAALLHPEHEPRRRRGRLRHQPARRRPAEDRRRLPGQQLRHRRAAANPVPHTQTVNALRLHFRAWVTKGTPPPPSRYPTLAQGTLAEANKAALGFPTLPALRPSVPEADFIMPVHDLDWGPQFNALDGSGVPSLAPPRIKQVLKMFAPKVDADGNELGGVPVVLLGAPLGTYLGWNIAAAGFHEGQICNYVGGMIPFARSAAERQASGDPRPSLEERYRDHDGYVRAVAAAAERAVSAGFLLDGDAAALIRAAQASAVLK